MLRPLHVLPRHLLFPPLFTGSWKEIFHCIIKGGHYITKHYSMAIKHLEKHQLCVTHRIKGNNISRKDQYNKYGIGSLYMVCCVYWHSNIIKVWIQSKHEQIRQHQNRQHFKPLRLKILLKKSLTFLFEIFLFCVLMRVFNKWLISSF